MGNSKKETDKLSEEIKSIKQQLDEAMTEKANKEEENAKLIEYYKS